MSASSSHYDSRLRASLLQLHSLTPLPRWHEFAPPEVRLGVLGRLFLIHIVRRVSPIRKVTLHGLRHTHLTNLLRAGVHPKIACERAGHSSVATTMDLYQHVMPGMQEDAAMRIDAALRTVLEQ